MELKLDQWATTPPVGYPGTVSPPPGKRSAGFTNGEEPPAGYFNHAWDALSDTQNELANLITGAGLTRVESDLSQVLKAVQRLIDRRAEILALTQWTEIGSCPAPVLGFACTPAGDAVAVCSANPSIRYAQATDVWASVTAGSSYAGVFNDVCWSDALGLVVVVGTGGEIQTAINAAGSYTRRATGGSDLLRCVAGANAVVAMSTDGAIKSSTNGVTWTTTATLSGGVTMSGLAYSPTLNRFCAVSNAAGIFPCM